MKIFGRTVGVMLCSTAVIHAQPTPRFDVAAIKQCRPSASGDGGRSGGYDTSPGRLHVRCMSVDALVKLAYTLNAPLINSNGMADKQSVRGGPAWTHSSFYTIEAKTEDAKANEPTTKASPAKKLMTGPMLQALLEDRFRLKVRRETREALVLVLTVAQASKLQLATEGICVPPDYSRPRQQIPPGQRYCNDLIGRKGPNTTLNVENATIDSFSKLLSIALDRPVIDKSGLLEKYNFHMEFATDPAMSGVGGLPALPSNEPPAASILTAALEQLGLKLESTKGQREFLVIDHVERPFPN